MSETLREQIETPSPTLAVTITGRTPADFIGRLNDLYLEVQEGRVEGVGGLVAEVRADCFYTEVGRNILPVLKTIEPPKLLTVRRAEEGGEWRGSEYQRKEMYKYLSPYVEGADAELATLDTAGFVVDAMARMNGTSIVSAHYPDTPKRHVIEEDYARACELGADFFKVAAALTKPKHINRLGIFVIEHDYDEVGVIAVGMGEEFRYEGRVEMMTEWGSPVGYVHDGTGKVAAGQYSLEEMLDELALRTQDNADG